VWKSATKNDFIFIGKTQGERTLYRMSESFNAKYIKIIINDIIPPYGPKSVMLGEIAFIK
jgi:hypothetical protein